MLTKLRAFWCRLVHRRDWRPFTRYDGERVSICDRCIIEHRHKESPER